MTPYEILLSESQERMLIIVERGREATVKEIFDKWDLPYACVGEVTDDGVMRVLNHGRVVVEIPADKLANDAPVYEREAVADPPVPELRIEDIPPADLHESLIRLLAHPTIASKNWVYRQYDHTVRAGTVVPPGSDAAVFYVREADKYLAATTDCNSLYCKLNPREGARIAVAEAARNLVCSGAKPLAVTDNLNFGNPYHPENFWQLREAVEGLAEACLRFGTPVTGGNVSLYNQNPSRRNRPYSDGGNGRRDRSGTLDHAAIFPGYVGRHLSDRSRWPRTGCEPISEDHPWPKGVSASPIELRSGVGGAGRRTGA